jgi:hypothetical protein
MYVIKMRDGTYFHTKGKIIIFETQSEINAFLNYFTQYSVNRLTREGRAEEAMTAPMQIMMGSVAMPVDFDINTVECGIVWARDFIKR